MFAINIIIELEGYQGGQCVDIDECIQHPCQNGGSCTNNNGSYTCHCRNGWIGPNCTVACVGGECQNQLMCSVVQNHYQCTCEAGFTGPLCEDIDECSNGSSDCQNAATCINSYGSYYCSCPGGFAGSKCEDDVNECDMHVSDRLNNNYIMNIYDIELYAHFEYVYLS